MVTPEDEPPQHEEDIDQQRRSLMAAAIRRGEVKISEPILWVEGVPDNTSDPRPVSTIVPQDSGFLETTEGGGGMAPGIAVSTDEFTAGEGEAGLRHKRSVSFIRETVQSRDMSLLANSVDQTSEDKRSVFVESEMASTSASPISQEKKGQKKRRSGLSAVLRKVFGRKEKRLSNTSPPTSRAGPKHEYTRSVSPQLQRYDGLLTRIRIRCRRPGPKPRRLNKDKVLTAKMRLLRCRTWKRMIMLCIHQYRRCCHSP